MKFMLKVIFVALMTLCFTAVYADVAPVQTATAPAATTPSAPPAQAKTWGKKDQLKKASPDSKKAMKQEKKGKKHAKKAKTKAQPKAAKPDQTPPAE